MPVERATANGRPGYRWGKEGKVYTYTPGSRTSRARAFAAATRQGQAARAAGYVERTFTPPAAVAAAARAALEVRAEAAPSNRGMTSVGLARARDLQNRRPVSLETIKRMANYFTRHASDKQGATWAERGKGWQAWQGWGGDAGARWARSILARYVD
jgi:hypothetical protein